MPVASFNAVWSSAMAADFAAGNAARWAIRCPRCFRSMVAEAQFCPFCGIAQDNEVMFWQMCNPPCCDEWCGCCCRQSERPA